MLINILTLFPEYFASSLASSMLKRAAVTEAVTYRVIDIRQFAADKHKVTDDRPFGGGPGMVMKIEPIAAALDSITQSLPSDAVHKIVLLSAQGALYTQQTARQYAQLDVLTLICGHYEGVDERVAAHLVDDEIRIGDYVLTGGEPAASVIVDSVVRLQPGVLGNDQSTAGESHEVPGRLGYPQYTRPADYNGWRVPEVLLGGDHAQIAQWREENRKVEPSEK